MGSPLERKLLDLRKQYLPFLQRTMGYLAQIRDTAECQKINGLIEVALNLDNLHQLQFETLEKCEQVCRNLYMKYGGDDEKRRGSSYKPPLTMDTHPREDDRRVQYHPNRGSEFPRELVGEPEDEDETPRSPSPEETRRVSTVFVPKEIPGRRTDLDLRIHPSVTHLPEPSSARSHNYRSSSVGDSVSPSRNLRTEPIEIPTVSQRFRSSTLPESFPQERDKDYRFDRPSPQHDRLLSFDDRHYSHQNSNRASFGGVPGISQLPSSGFPPGAPSNRRESRFDSQRRDNSPIGSSPRDTDLRVPHHDRRVVVHDVDRDNRQFHSNRDSYPAAHQAGSRFNQHQQSWNSSSAQHNPALPFPRSSSRWGPQSGMVEHSSSLHQILPQGGRGPDGIQPRVVAHESTRQDLNRPCVEKDPGTHRSPIQSGLPQRPVPTRVTNPSSSSSTQNSNRNANLSYPQRAQQITPPLAVPASTVPPRREDPRLANRPKPTSVPSGSSTTNERNQTSASSNTRTVELKDSQRSPSVKDPVAKESTRVSNTGSQKDSSPVKPSPQPAGEGSRGADDFVSPLNSLYSGGQKSTVAQTGRGYGVQTYKIPKKKTETPHSPSKTKPSSTCSEEANLSSSEEGNQSSIVSIKAPESGREAGTDSTSGQDDLPSIPLDVLEDYLNKALPSDDAQKVMEKIKTKTATDIPKTQNEKNSISQSVESGSETASTSQTSTLRSKKSSVTDTTVTSSSDGVVLMEEGGETTKTDDNAHSDTDVKSTTQDRKLRGRPRKDNVPLEVARLREDLTDFMKGSLEPGSRRSRSRTATNTALVLRDPHADDELSDATTSSRGSQATGPPPSSKGKRGRKRKIASQVDDSFEPNEASISQTDQLPSSLDSSSTIELNTTPESTKETSQPPAKVVGGGKKKKKIPAKKKATKDDPNAEGPTEENASKGQKRKKTFIPTRLSLRGRPSMYENAEPSDAKVVESEDQKEIPGSGDQEYFQCKNCAYCGQKIVHHYVNEHPGLEIPYIVVPVSKWEVICTSDQSAGAPSSHRVNQELLKDLSWIPSRANYQSSPVHCKLCNYSASKRSELLEHVFVHALPDNCEYTCILCSKTETNFFKMYDHVATHTGEYRFACSYCEYKVSTRPGIKQHMASLHESQDALFYSTTLPEADQLWIYGFVCKTCRFVQMGEDRVKSHLASHPECNEYIKINLISVVRDVQEDQMEETGADAFGTRPFGNLSPLGNDQGVFLCSPLDKERRPIEEDEDVNVALALPSIDLIQSITDKLNTPYSEEAPSTSDHLGKAKPRTCPAPATPSTEVPLLSKAVSQVRLSINSESSDDEHRMQICEETVHHSSDEGTSIPERLVLKPNTWLETTISKLAGKLRPVSDQEPEEIAASPSPSSDSDEDDDSDYEDECEDAEDEEEESASEEMKETINPASFLRIENVISLNEMDMGDLDSLDPVSSVLLHSNVTIAKGEITFPYRVPHNRAEFAASLKEDETYKKMLDRTRIRHFFKCMAYRCIFSCDSFDDYAQHLNWHYKQFLTPNFHEAVPERRIVPVNDESKGRKIETVTLPDFFLCPYCPATAESPEVLADHLDIYHSCSTFQCSACFFRGWAHKIVAIHAIVAHPSLNTHILDCKKISRNIPRSLKEEDELTVRGLARYPCCVENCSFSSVHRASLVKHLTVSHPGIQQFRCRLCQDEILCTSSDYVALFLHMNKHGMGFFQCAFCEFGSDLPGDILLHTCLNHPSSRGKVLLRCVNAIPSSVTVRTLLRFWVSSLPHMYSNDPSRQIDLDHRYRELFHFVDVIESDLTPEEDMYDNAVVTTAPPVPDFIITERTPTLGEKTETEPSQEARTDADATEFHGFDEEEGNQAKAKRLSAERLILDSGSGEDEENIPVVPSVNQSSQEQSGEEKMDEEEQDGGLYGRQLYVCGNMGCEVTAETPASLKEHIMVCDLARDSRLLTCHHCGKSMKQVANLIDHLRQHGIKRFSCGLCHFRAFQAGGVRKHFKTLHRVSVVDEVPSGQGPGPANADNTHYVLYPREMASRLKNRARMSSRIGGSKIFTCKEVGRIPMKSILPCSIQCAHCGYSSKVRANMVHHLSLHEKRIEAPNGTSSEGEEIIPRVVIPDQAPVNPVPYLETPSKGRMFDKMANLAYSSHSGKDQPDKKRMGSASASAAEDSASEDGASFLPVFIPDHKRYVCGLKGCGHLTINEGNLKYHLQTLHKNSSFSCPHCTKLDEEPVSLEVFRSHLKMHGPQLFKCSHCVFYHWQQQEMDAHLVDKHPNRSPWQVIIRKPEDTEIKRQQQCSNQTPEKTNSIELPWKCSLCKHSTSLQGDMFTHIAASHGIMNQFKCAFCPVRCNIRSEFDRHFASKHPKQEVQVLSMFIKQEAGEVNKPPELEVTPPSNFQPLWNRRQPRLRHIRGILLEENEMKNPDDAPPMPVNKSLIPNDPTYGSFGAPSPNGLLCCPRCDYKVANGMNLKAHLYRELEYKKFLCSVCNEGECSRALALKHIEKKHPKERDAFIREILSNKPLEDWVEKVIKIQTAALKSTKANIPSVPKKVTVSASPTSSPASSPSKHPLAKTKKAAANKTPLPEVILLDVDPGSTKGPTPAGASFFLCLACDFIARTDVILEEHVVSAHANVPDSCRHCGFKATAKQSMADHQLKTSHFKVTPSSKSGDGKNAEEQVKVQNQVDRAKKVVASPSSQFKCSHCTFSAPNEHRINLHWKSSHPNLPLTFEVVAPSTSTGKQESGKILYKCHNCGTTGTFDELKEHSKSLHPNVAARLSRIPTTRVRPSVDQSSGAVEIKTLGEPVAKKSKPDVTIQPVNSEKSVQPAVSIFPVQQSPPKAVPKKIPGPSSQPVFVVASPPAVTPSYTCVCCMSRFMQEAEVIRHHASHSASVPLRYTCLGVPKPGATANPGAKPEFVVMEIHFGCPVCPKYFMSLVAARAHVTEHKQAWKCGHCEMLFGSPSLALQHWKDAHPGLEGRLESIDSPKQINEKLSNGITLTRVQMKSRDLLKPPQTSEPKEPIGIPKENKASEPSTSSSISPINSIRTSAVAKKSTSSNSFLKQAPIKMSSTSSPTHPESG